MDNNGDLGRSSRSEDEEARKDDQTQQVIYAVSHDLRAPARHINAFVGLLSAHLGDDLDDVAAGYIARLVNASEVLDTKLDALGTYSRVATRGAPLKPCAASDSVEGALTTLKGEIEEANARVVVGDIPVVLADSWQLTAVFTELIGNSLKFCATGVSIEIDGHVSDGQAVIQIADDGPGYTDQGPERALELFRRFHAGSIPGVGAGLATVKRIMHRHDGGITIETGTDRGTIVRLTLPNAGGGA